MHTIIFSCPLRACKNNSCMCWLFLYLVHIVQSSIVINSSKIFLSFFFFVLQPIGLFKKQTNKQSKMGKSA